ncbi:Polyadenylate-binding protein RBP47C' [Acorus calamus]|uniref:Polyadenylate-binding protein RBP47C n=1 Tax=Acorus calamus TaxID=4465 RepID=A0AAV9DTX0_ACOCL|nr:Polyadenylate-binding protein RBP47C' [Acorus calamus]
MSRLCVKNLPKYVAEDRLRDFFSQKGEVTDVKLIRTKDRKSRQFGFVGFRSEGEAEAAIKYFNNSYLDTCRITCEIARKIGDPNIPRPWSRHSAKVEDSLNRKNKENKGVKDSSPLHSKELKVPNKIVKNLKSKENSDPRLQEFLQLMQPRTKTKLWANDTLDDHLDENKKVDGQPRKSIKGDKKKSTGMHEDGIESGSESDCSGYTDTFSGEQANNMVHEDLMDDQGSDEEVNLEGAHQQHEAIEDIDDEKLDNTNPSMELNDEDKLSLESGRLFVRNLPYATNEEELVELFGKFGDIAQVHIVVDKATNQSKGIGYILYIVPESAVRALQELDQSVFQGRLLHVMPAKQQTSSSENHESFDAGDTAGKKFKQQREEQRRASELGGDTRAWNSLFMRPDTVVDNIARIFGVSKSDVLDPEAKDLASRLALGETYVIKETKQALSNAGINVSALEEFISKGTDSVKRSNHVILVKNLPYSSSEGDLAQMFGKFGSLDKIILPPTKTLALVIFLEAAEARAAFKCLAYKRFKDAPLYLEWAPSEILSLNPSSETDKQNNAVVGEKDVKKMLLEQSVEGISEEDIDPDRVESRTLFVKNINFRTSDENLNKHFTDNVKNGVIRSVKIKKHLKNGKNVSMGFGFIEFDSVETATKVCKDLQGTVLDGHALMLQLCHAKDDRTIKKVENDRSLTKLIVRNVAFEATEKDLRQLFSPFGQIKSLRLPLKVGKHRGFAFVEYVTKQEAQNAIQALSSTHLYGRHLVIERAKEGESLEELRKRTAAQFTDEQNGFFNPTKLSKKRKQLSAVEEGRVKFERIMS